MKKILISLVIISLIIGAASGLPKLGANQGFSNPGSVELGGDLTVGGNLAVGGTTITNGVIDDDVVIEAGHDLSANAGDGKFDWSLGTGMFNTTSGANYFNGNGTFATGKTLTVPGGFVGPLTGAVTGAVTGDVTGNVTAAGTVQAEQLTSTDDLNVTDDIYAEDLITDNTVQSGLIAASGDLTAGDDAIIADDLVVDGGARIDETLTVNALAVNTTTTLNGNTDTGSGDYLNVTTADKLLVGGVIVPTAIPIASFPYTASSVDQGVFTASGAWTLTAVKMTPRVVGSSESAVTVMVKICDSGEAPASGDNMLSGTLDLKGTADTPQSGTVSSGAIATGKIVALDFTGDLTAAVGVITLYGTRA